MTSSNQTSPEAATSAEDQHPSIPQQFKHRRFPRNPVVVYDYDQKTVEVQSREEAESENNYKRLEFTARTRQLTVFLDGDSKLTTRSTDGGGKLNIMLVELYLDRLGPYGRTLRFLGLLNILYVKNAEHLNETPPQI